MEEVKIGLEALFRSQSAEDLGQVRTALDLLSRQIEVMIPQFGTDSDENHLALRHAARFGRAVTVTGAVAVGSTVALTTFLISWGRRRALLETQTERDNLASLTIALQKRNDQLAALYNVVTEVTDSLNMQYVVNTAINEARKLVAADYVALRLLDNNVLQIAGSVGDDDFDLSSLKDLPLGVGLVGRAAKRGRTLRLDEMAYASMAEEERIADVQSGLIVPLIVGARVLGTLGCWSRRPSGFDADDERILELMASQVATAVAAANLHHATALQASNDALTGLPNRRQLLEDEQVFAEWLVRNERFGLLMYDVDHFKDFNDNFGHRVGDVTLQKVAEVLRSSIREGDRIYRYGGEEFLVVLPHVEPQEALILAERLRKVVEKIPLTGMNLEPVGPVTISAGVALAPDHGTTFQVLLAAADRALYRSKEAGRNQVMLAQAISESEQIAA
jgi:diguanylate cyclase (GGDEF)-like protein